MRIALCTLRRKILAQRREKHSGRSRGTRIARMRTHVEILTGFLQRRLRLALIINCDSHAGRVSRFLSVTNYVLLYVYIYINYITYILFASRFAIFSLKKSFSSAIFLSLSLVHLLFEEFLKISEYIIDNFLQFSY